MGEFVIRIKVYKKLFRFLYYGLIALGFKPEPKLRRFKNIYILMV